VNKWQWTSTERKLEMAEDKITELEAVIIVAHDALEFNHQLLTAIIEQGETNGWIIAHPDWLKAAAFKSELALAATKHRRV
jgi:hypothetical protein